MEYCIKNVHRPDLIKLVRDYISSNVKSYGGYYNYLYDDDYYDDWYDDWYGIGNRYGLNHVNGVSSVVSRLFPDDDEIVLDTDDEGFKEIYFYSDIGCGEDPDERFSSLKELREYCDMMGIHISDSLYNSLRSEHIIHCCVDPVAKRHGECKLESDYSYGNLYWKCYDALQDDIDDTSIVGNYGDMKYNGVDLPF